MKKTVLLITLVVMSLAARPARAENLLPPDLAGRCVTKTLPAYDPRFPGSQLVLICIPEAWNRELVVYAHGYVAPQDPLALPIAELTLPDGSTVPGILMSLGYGFAASSFHKNGYAIEQAGADLNRLVRYVTTTIVPGQVENVYIAGASEGGLITTMLLERHPETFRGGLALCAPVGGAPFQIKYLTDFRVVFDYYYPAVFGFGAYDVPAGAWRFWDSYLLAITGAVLFDRESADQLFDVTRAALDPKDRTTLAETATTDLFYSIWGINDLIETAGGRPYDNRRTWYTGSENDLALNRGVERVQADREAQQYLRKFYQPTGKLVRPLVTLHTTQDPAAPYRHELLYSALARKAGSSQFLTQLPVYRYGHCNFTTEEILGAFQLMVLKAR